MLGYENSSTYRVLVGNNLAISKNVRFNEDRMGTYNPTTYKKRTCGDLTYYLNQSIQWEENGTELTDLGTTTPPEPENDTQNLLSVPQEETGSDLTLQGNSGEE